ncbi:MAG: hypothetical protein EZS28_051600 [Streblomastix strix]|uniref:Uncharacterized protein n=1 Tax=Streblomastix strix TaxID=222440 RepID=A0A5J4T558_9EUKA|nr:MAG: hypothetical protein EZS28_051600 [Streblomastix strix]
MPIWHMAGTLQRSSLTLDTQDTQDTQFCNRYSIAFVHQHINRKTDLIVIGERITLMAILHMVGTLQGSSLTQDTQDTQDPQFCNRYSISFVHYHINRVSLIITLAIKSIIIRATVRLVYFQAIQAFLSCTPAHFITQNRSTSIVSHIYQCISLSSIYSFPIIPVSSLKTDQLHRQSHPLTHIAIEYLFLFHHPSFITQNRSTSSQSITLIDQHQRIPIA